MGSSDEGYDTVSLNDEEIITGEEDGGSGITKVIVVEVEAGDSITLTYDGAAGVCHDSGYATITEIELVDEQCSDGCAPGNGSVSNGSLHMSMNMGRAEHGASVGAIRIDEERPSATLGTPASLRYGGKAWGEAVKVIRDGSGHLRQVRTPQVLADVVVETGTRFRIDFYESSQVGLFSSGLYDQTGKTPYVTWVMENLNPLTNGQFKVTEVVGSSSRESEFVWDPLGQGWELTTGNGLRSVAKTEVEDALANTLTVTEIVQDGSSNVASKTVNVYKDFPWGRELIQTVLDPDGAALTTDYVFYDNSGVDGGAYGKLKNMISSEGPWSCYEYDSKGRETKHVEGYLDNVPLSADNLNKVATTTYSDLAPQETRIVTIKGQEVGRTYLAKAKGGVRETKNVVCTGPNAYNHSSNLVTKTLEVEVAPFKTEIERIERPDGTAETFSYSLSGSNKITVARKGAFSGGNVIAGTKTTTTVDVAGNLISEVVVDIESNITLSTKTVVSKDSFGRPTEIAYNDGTTEEFEYGCCGVEMEKDRNGNVTLTTYDALKRVISRSQGGITTLYTYDAAGRVLTTTRRGSDDSDIVTETVTYDLVGRVTSRKNGLNQTTSYSVAIGGSGGAVRTTTMPDSSTQIEATYRDGQLKEISGTASRPLKYEYGTSNTGLQFVKEIRVGEGASESEWAKTWTDPAGRTVKIEYPGGAEEMLAYNTKGQLVKQVDADGVARLYSYNARGEQTEQAIDTDGSDTINNGDRRVKTLRSVVAGPLMRTVTQQEGDSGYVTVSTTDVSPNGRYQKVTQHGLETETETTYASNGDSTQMTTHPDGSTSTTESENGRPVATERKAYGGATIASTAYEYDPHGRLSKQTDGRVGTETTYTYNDADQNTSINAGGMVTSYAYNSLGQVTTETLPGTSRTVTRTYLPTGEVLTEGGTATYPITYTYDPQGRRRTMVTSSGTTTWTYSATRGLLASKADAQSEATTYTYTSAGRLATRTWARGIVTTYGYNGAGELASVSYSDSTPGVTFAYDSQGRPTEITDASGTRTLGYNAAGQLEGESISGGILNGVNLSATYDSLLRRSSFTAARNSTTLANSAFTYDGASRLATVSSGDQSAAYNYLAGSSLVSQIAFKQSGTPAMTTTKSYDGLNRLSSISSAPAVGDAVSYAYQYNAAGQRDQITLANGDTWNYGYNSRGEVTSGSKKRGVTNLLGYQFSYAYDDLGNRTSAVINGRTSTYTANSLNQYTSRTVPGYVNVIGTAKAATTVTVNTEAVTRQGDEYHKELSVDNSADPVYLSTSVQGTLGSDTAELNGKLFIPKTPKAFTYDEDGNLLSDGRWTYQWDGENRLIGMETQAGVAAVGAPRQRLTFAYDQKSRRISKKVEDWKGSRYQERFTMLFLYERWNLVAEVLAVGPKIRSYVWGSDLAGGSAAGGVGGLLFFGQYPESKIYSVGYDGHGNVMMLLDMGGGGALAGSYEYSPWGEILHKNGAAALVNPFRFSTKYVDDESRLIYYGYRFYDSVGGRWLTRDPIGERGGVNLYGFNHNSPLIYIDPLGLSSIGKGCCKEEDLDKIGKEYSEMASRKTQSDSDPKREYAGIICCKDGKLKATEPHPGPRPKEWQTPSGRWETGRAVVDPHYDASTSKVVSCAGLFWFSKGVVEVAAYHSHTDNSNFSGLDQGVANRNGYPFYKGDEDGSVWRLDPSETKKGSSDEDVGPAKKIL